MRSKEKRVSAAAAALLAMAGLCARGLYLWRRPFWFDEMFTLWISRKSPKALLAALRADSGPPLFYLLEKPFTRLAELLRLDAGTRLLPFLALAVLFALNGRRRFSAGFPYTLLLATCPLLFFYSAEARGYALLALGSFCLFLATDRFRRGPMAFWSVALLCAALPMIHYLGGLVLVSSAAFCALAKRWKLVAGHVLGGCVFLLWLPVALTQPTQALGWSGESAARSALGFLGKIGFWGSYPGYFTAAATPLPALGVVLGLLLLAMTALAARRVRSVRAALAYALGPILLSAAFGVFHPIFFSGRTEMATLPVLLWAAGRAAKHSGGARLLCRLTAAAGAGVLLLALASPPSPAPYAVTARFLVSRARAGDLTIAGEADYLPLSLARDRGELAGRLVGAPSSVESHPGWFEPGRIDNPANEASRLAAAAALVRSGSTIRIAFPPDPALQELARTALSGRPGRVSLPPGGDAVLELAGR